MKAMRNVLPAGLLAAALAAGLPGAARAADDAGAEIRALREQIRLLDQRLHQLEQQQEARAQEAAAAKAAAPAAPKVSLTDKGFTFASGDGANSVSIRGLVQFDSRLFFDRRDSANNTFVLRRARPIIEGTFGGIYSFQFVPEFGGTGAATILDANLGIAVSKAVQFRFGKFKAPVGLEQLQSDSWTFFNERSMVSGLVPNRDVGAQVGGGFRDGAVTYAAGIFNGVADGGSTTNADFDRDKELVGRLFVRPFKADAGSPLQGLGFGAAASLSRTKTSAALTSGYRTDGQQTFFRYRSGVVADGQAWRISPQAEYRSGPFGAIGEYVVSTVNARPTAAGARAELRNRGWQIAAGYVLTGEASSAAGVAPDRPFNWQNRTWGAWEIAVRYASLTIDDHAFPLFADPAASAREANATGIGLSWYLSRTIRATVDYYQTSFDVPEVPPAAPADRPDEQALITRFQVSF